MAGATALKNGCQGDRLVAPSGTLTAIRSVTAGSCQGGSAQV